MFKHWDDDVARVNISLTPGERLYLYMRRMRNTVVHVEELGARLGLRDLKAVRDAIRGKGPCPEVILNDGMTFGEMLFLARYRTGANVSEFAAMVKMTPAAVRRTERRHSRIAPRRTSKQDRDVWTLMKYWHNEGWPMIAVPRKAFIPDFD